MKYVLSAEEMRNIDKATIENIGIASEVLMERAAIVCAEEIRSSGFDTSRILIVCGMGNNGADGLALGRIINKFYKPDVYLVGAYKELRGIVKAQYDSAAKSKVRFISDPDYSEYTLIIDAVFGIGFKGKLCEPTLSVVKQINAAAAKVISVDVPSGLDATNGNIANEAVKADLTVTFAYAKLGELIHLGPDYTGTLHTRDIGIYADLCTDMTKLMFTYNERDLTLIPKRRRYSNKGSYGRVLALAGSETMSGAAILSAKAAYKSGAGLVEVFTHEKVRQSLGQALPEAIVSTYNDVKTDFNKLYDSLNNSSAVLIGPGLSKSENAKKLLRYTLETSAVPTVIDADALNIISEHTELLPYIKGKIITPHLGEMSRLTGKSISEIADSIADTAKEFCEKYGCVCILKDARTVVSAPNEPLYINTAGNSGLAKGGSGDTLAGIIVSLLAQGVPKPDAARLGVFLHSYAADTAAKEKGEYALLASDVSNTVGEIMKQYK